MNNIESLEFFKLTKNAATVSPPLEGQWIWLKNRDMCVKLSGNNQRVSQAPCQNQPAYLWQFTKNSDGTYIITSKSGNQVLDVDGGSKGNDAGIIAFEKHGGPNQRWTVLPYSQPNQFLIKSFN